MGSWSGIVVHTIGHSTRPLDELIGCLSSFAITDLVDIRTVPRSRRHPQFETNALAVSLPAAGVRYEHLGALGGLRKPKKDSPNAGWRNESFRGYADHMASPGFEEGLARLHAIATAGRAAIMCAEAVPWRCHRSLVADALVARGAEVLHIMAPGKASPHRLTSFARLDGERVTYPALV
jgi:uncharacterized protein (DUF488 family)